MKISINTPSEFKLNGFQDSATGRTTKTLGKFSNRIASVNITLTDENGPRGGIDKRCRVIVVMPGYGELTTTAEHENPLAAVSQAAERARRVVLTKLKRPKALRIRRRKAHYESSVSESDETLTI